MKEERPTPEDSAARFESIVLRAAVIVLVVLFIYAPVFHGDWLMDDNFEVTENDTLRSAAGLLKIWQGQGGADYLPLKSTLLWVLWQGFGNAPTAYHLTSIGLHLVSALLIWRLFFRLGMRYAWLGGLLFAAHPITVESVAWASELKNTFSLAVLLTAMLAWLRFCERQRWRDYAWALGLFVAALLCKSSVIMWPVVILLHAWWKRGRLTARDGLYSAAFFAVSLAVGGLTIHLQTLRAIGGETFPIQGVASRVAVAGLDLAFYLWKTLIPAGLLPMYPRWNISPPRAVQFLPWLAVGGLFAWLWMKRLTVWGRTALFGLGFFVVNLAPVLGFVNMSYMRIAWAADHFAYLPCLGIIGLAAAGIGMGYEQLAGRRRMAAVCGGWLAFGTLIAASHAHAGLHVNLYELCKHTVARNPDAWLAHQLYAVQLQNRGDYRTALDHAREAYRQNPDTVEVCNTMGTSLETTGDPREAIRYFQEALQLAPKIALIRVNLGRCYMATGRFEEAANEYALLVNLAPGNGDFRFNLARCSARIGRYDEALEQYGILIASAPDNPVLHSDAGVCLYGLGRWRESVEQFRVALRINPNLADAREGLEGALKKQSEALDTLRLDPPR